VFSSKPNKLNFAITQTIVKINQHIVNFGDEVKII